MTPYDPPDDPMNLSPGLDAGDVPDLGIDPADATVVETDAAFGGGGLPPLAEDIVYEPPEPPAHTAPPFPLEPVAPVEPVEPVDPKPITGARDPLIPDDIGSEGWTDDPMTDFVGAVEEESFAPSIPRHDAPRHTADRKAVVEDVDALDDAMAAKLRHELDVDDPDDLAHLDDEDIAETFSSGESRYVRKARKQAKQGNVEKDDIPPQVLDAIREDRGETVVESPRQTNGGEISREEVAEVNEAIREKAGSVRNAIESRLADDDDEPGVDDEQIVDEDGDGIDDDADPQVQRVKVQSADEGENVQRVQVQSADEYDDGGSDETVTERAREAVRNLRNRLSR